ncbi:hypothetical protein EDC04DRAFT_2601911 [Pisolithus marmoratus]|nr:hypothetical protein EDC04DRAFT_2601911 [Pisolithus marmoratus]
MFTVCQNLEENQVVLHCITSQPHIESSEISFSDPDTDCGDGDWIDADSAFDMPFNDLSEEASDSTRDLLTYQSNHVPFHSEQQKCFANLLNCSLLGPDGSFSPSKPSLPPSMVIKHGNCRKGSTKSYLLLALLPVPKFVHPNKHLHGVLADWLLHQVISIVVKPLKWAANSYCIKNPSTTYYGQKKNLCSKFVFIKHLSLLQVPKIMGTDITKLTASLQEFHDNKSALMEASMWGSLDHWQIPKLEIMLAIAPSISSMDALVQWSADITEHTHINIIKNPI